VTHKRGHVNNTEGFVPRWRFVADLMVGQASSMEHFF
jgi:hypothetical protein